MTPAAAKSVLATLGHGFAVHQSGRYFTLRMDCDDAEKMLPRQSDARRGALNALVKAFSFTAAEKTAGAARKAAYYIEEGDNLTMMLSGIRRFTKYDATGLLQAKRALADAGIAAEKYLF